MEKFDDELPQRKFDNFQFVRPYPTLRALPFTLPLPLPLAA